MPALRESGYDPVKGQHPGLLIDEHPDGVHVALLGHDQGGIWDRRSGRVVWAPPATSAICWLSGGREVVLIRDRDYARPLDHVSALYWPSRPSLCFFERRSWPVLRFISVCPVGSKDGNWIVGARASPRGDIVAVQWMEQHVGGFELVAIGPDGDGQVEGAGYGAEPNCVSSPTFSPDGRYLVMACGRYGFWSTEEEIWNADDPEEVSSPGGRFVVGHILMRDLDAGTQWEMPVEDEIPAGWVPPPFDGEVCADQPISDPHFEGPTAFSVRLLTGTTQRFSVAALPDRS